MQLSTAQAGKLAHLATGHSLPRSDLPERLLAPLCEAGVVRLERSGRSYRVRGVPGKLPTFIEHKWGIRDLTRFANASPEKRDRALLAEIAGDSKALPHRPFEGIFLRSFGGCFLGERRLGENPPGSATFITLRDLPRLRVETRYLVGIENTACLWEFEKVLPHFPQLDPADCTLVLRWHWGEVWRRWLAEWPGQLFYFGDYDPAGLRIFASEVLPFRPDARLLIPTSFHEILAQRGLRELFLRQEQTLGSLAEHRDITSIKTVLMQVRKALEQENLLSL